MARSRPEAPSTSPGPEPKGTATRPTANTFSMGYARQVLRADRRWRSRPCATRSGLTKPSEGQCDLEDVEGVIARVVDVAVMALSAGRAEQQGCAPRRSSVIARSQLRRLTHNLQCRRLYPTSGHCRVAPERSALPCAGAGSRRFPVLLLAGLEKVHWALRPAQFLSVS